MSCDKKFPEVSISKLLPEMLQMFFILNSEAKIYQALPNLPPSESLKVSRISQSYQSVTTNAKARIRRENVHWHLSGSLASIWKIPVLKSRNLNIDVNMYTSSDSRFSNISHWHFHIIWKRWHTHTISNRAINMRHISHLAAWCDITHLQSNLTFESSTITTFRLSRPCTITKR